MKSRAKLKTEDDRRNLISKPYVEQENSILEFMAGDHHSKDTSERSYLPTGTIIDQYIIERGLAVGGFSCVYLARQLSDQFQVAIKEYLPRRLANRAPDNNVVPHNQEEKRRLFEAGRKLFFEEAKVLAALKHPNIVEVINFFPANSTVYLVMTYDYGKTLDFCIKESPEMFNAEFIIGTFRSLLDGLKMIHDYGLLHLDIKPSNILIRPGLGPLLLDFGAVHEFPSSAEYKPRKVLSNGFSPIEQYSYDANLGPWSDVYAVGATLRTCLEGKPPISAQKRESGDAFVPARQLLRGEFPEPLLVAIDWAMQIAPEHRPQSIVEFLAALPQL